MTDNGTPPLASTRVFAVQVQGRPALTITLTNGQSRLAWNTIAGQQYQPQYKTRLSDASWVSLGLPVSASGDTTAVLDTTLTATTNRFYRVKLLP